MVSYDRMTKEELLKEDESLREAYKDYQKRDLSLNMARGKPSPAQLALSGDLLSILKPDDFIDKESGIDVRNYGCLDGLPGMKRILSDMTGCKEEDVIVCGNSSLNIMYDQVERAMVTGIMGSTPWSKLDEVKWLCPVPGYDRHFAITEHFGIKMINVPMLDDGPDMDMVEELVKDPAVKGIWCVPKYSNPEGKVYSEKVVMRFASLKPAAGDFRIFWDNAYCVHHLYDDAERQAEIPDIISACNMAGNPDMVFEFMSTSKITFPGAGIAGIAASPANRKDILSSMSAQTIGYDKINQMRHIRFFESIGGVREQMKRHAAILRPKFDIVKNTFEKELLGRDCGSWTSPMGGYFVTFRTLPGLAKKVVSISKEAGVTLTGAGAPFPYHMDPEDSAIRIAPSFPSEEELQEAMNIFCLAVRMATVEKMLGKD